MGRVEQIHLADSKGLPMRAVSSAKAIANLGLEGDRYALGLGWWSKDPRKGRHLTLIEAEAIEELRGQGIELAPGEPRRNLVSHAASP
jgi:hypothetical protein